MTEGSGAMHEDPGPTTGRRTPKDQQGPRQPKTARMTPRKRQGRRWETSEVRGGGTGEVGDPGHVNNDGVRKDRHVGGTANDDQIVGEEHNTQTKPMGRKQKKGIFVIGSTILIQTLSPLIFPIGSTMMIQTFPPCMLPLHSSFTEIYLQLE